MVLKHRDRELLRFEWTGARGVRALSVNESERKFLPIGMFCSASDASLWKWISTRTVPRGRKYILSALRQLGIPSDDIRAIVNFSRGLSLNDVYWIVEDGFTGCWKDYNLYENDFSEDVAALALKHYNLVDERLDVIESFIQERVENILNYGEKADALLSMGVLHVF